MRERGRTNSIGKWLMLPMIVCMPDRHLMAARMRRPRSRPHLFAVQTAGQQLVELKSQLATVTQALKEKDAELEALKRQRRDEFGTHGRGYLLLGERYSVHSCQCSRCQAPSRRGSLD